MQGIYVIKLSSNSVLSKKMTMSAHKKNLYGGVVSTMAEVRSLIWIPVLRKLTKYVTRAHTDS